jgi:type 1 glutamine amidotransferase
MTRRFFFALIALTLFGVAEGVFSLNTAQAQTAPKLKALIVDGQNNHNWRGTTPVLKSMLETSGRFTVDVATSPTKKDKETDADAYKTNLAAFKPDFAKYDVIIGNYNSNDTHDDWSPETKKAFEEYIENGGGFVSYHAADNSFPNWVAFNKMVGLGGWDRGHLPADAGKYPYWEDGKAATSNETGRPRGNHGPQWAFPIDVRDAKHPITAGLPETFRHCQDELYDYMWGPAENVTILATAYADKERGGSGRHEPMLMAISYGKGRIFHTALGHDVQQVRSVSFIVTFLRGAEWAATGKVTIPVPDDFPGKDQPTFRNE